MAPTISEKSGSKYENLAQELRQRIIDGELQPGDRLPSFSELRAQQGLTLWTIEKALTSLESGGLIDRVHGKGVFVAQRPATSATRCLGFLGRKQGTPAWSLYWVQFMKGVQAGAHGKGYDVLLINPAPSSAWHDKVDGVILHEMTPEEHAGAQLPAFRVNVLTAVPGLASVVADDYGGAYQAVQHLLDLGHRRIAYLVDDSHYATQMRLTGYRAALRDGGVTASPDWVRVLKDRTQSGLFEQWGKTEMRDWLSSDWRRLGCTALLCHNDEVAMGVMQTLQEEGIRIPHDLSLVGYDGTILCETVQPKLTSVEVPLREIGLRAAVMLIEQIESGRVEPVTLSLPSTLQLRGSTSRVHPAKG